MQPLFQVAIGQSLLRLQTRILKVSDVRILRRTSGSRAGLWETHLGGPAAGAGARRGHSPRVPGRRSHRWSRELVWRLAALRHALGHQQHAPEWHASWRRMKMTSSDKSIMTKAGAGANARRAPSEDVQSLALPRGTGKGRKPAGRALSTGSKENSETSEEGSEKHESRNHKLENEGAVQRSHSVASVVLKV